jgi:hypothetical protein
MARIAANAILSIFVVGFGPKKGVWCGGNSSGI